MDNNQVPNTLIRFLCSICPQLHLLDMGRRVEQIPIETFLRIENCAALYPYPLQQQAWVGLLFPWHGPSQESSVWFLNFPLDEQGLLNQFARDDLLQRLLERLGSDTRKVNGVTRVENALEDNPYSFKPRDELLAVFHARASRLLDGAPSRHYQHARDYFRGDLGWDQWPFLGYQGIAELAARLDTEDNTGILLDALPLLPDRPYEALCHCLEHEQVSDVIAAALSASAAEQLAEPQPDRPRVAASIRGVSRCASVSLRDALLDRVLAHPVSEDPLILTAIGGRAWEALADGLRATTFLDRLAVNAQGQTLFDQCLTDLLFLPDMREPLLQALRSPERSGPLSRAVGLFFQRIRG